MSARSSTRPDGAVEAVGQHEQRVTRAGGSGSTKPRKPGSISTDAMKASISAGVARTRSIWRTMHSREPMRPAFHSSSMSRHAGAANRSSSRSVVSTGAIVPSKSSRTRHFTRAIDTPTEPVDLICRTWPRGREECSLFSPRLTLCQWLWFTFSSAKPHLLLVRIDIPRTPWLTLGARSRSASDRQMTSGNVDRSRHMAAAHRSLRSGRAAPMSRRGAMLGESLASLRSA